MADQLLKKLKDEYCLENVIDAQVYVASLDFVPSGFIDSISQGLQLWMQAQGVEYNENRIKALCSSYFDDPQCDKLVKQMDEAGIDKSVLMLPDFTYRFSDSVLNMDQMIAGIKLILKRHPGRFYYWLGIDPRWGKKGLERFEAEVATGLVKGMKLYPPCGFSPSDEAMYPYYEICRNNGLPVSIHTGGTANVFQLDLSYPRLIDKACLAFPEVDFILSHASTCYSDEALMLCSARPNIYLEVSGYASQPIEKLTELFKYGVNHKIIFATDWPSFRAQGPQSTFIDQFFSEGGPINYMRDFEVKRFFGETIKSLMK